MGNQVYSRAEYIIIHVSRGGYVIINKKKGFKNGHTHIRNFTTAKYLIGCCINNRIPNDLTPYLLQSLIRITDSYSYAEKCRILMENKLNRKNNQTVKKGH